MNSNLREIVVILGNGFDMDLGLNTSYKHFSESPYWPSDSNPSDLKTHIENHLMHNWYDLESSLGDYYMNRHVTNADKVKADREYYIKLKQSLKEFITNEEKNFKKLRPNSFALKCIEAVYKYRKPIIYSFNYTNLNGLVHSALFSRLLEIVDLPYTHVHGSTNTEIIFGIQDNEFNSKYDFLKKISDPTYQSNNLYYDLIRAKEVVIFGHSLGANDYHFFRKFFQLHSSESNSDEKNKCRITFFTANSQSRMDLLANLRSMNNGMNNQLFAQNELMFIRTCDYDIYSQSDFYDWLRYLETCQ